MMMIVADYDPNLGQAFQGDIAIVPIPKTVVIATHDEIKPIEGLLIIQKGELSGHRHAIKMAQSPMFGADVRNTVIRLLKRTTNDGTAAARLYRDPTAVAELVRRGVLTRADLAIGCLVVEGGAVIVSHEQHGGIRVPPGQYYVGRQIESAGADARVVRD
jgi:hypothetical protein